MESWPDLLDRLRDVLLDPAAEAERGDARIARLGRALLAEIPRLFPSQIGLNAVSPRRDPAPPLPERLLQTSRAIPAPASGYLRDVNGDALLRLARRRDLVIHISHRPGAFLLRDAPLAHAHPSSRVSSEILRQLQDAFLFCDSRLEIGDAESRIRQLAQLACRFLAPALNDPFAALACIDWLGAGLRALTGQVLPSPFRNDAEQVLCVVAPSTSFTELAERSFAEIRHLASGSPTVLVHLFEQAAELARFARRSEDRRWLALHILGVQEASRHWSTSRADRERLELAWKMAALAIGVDTSEPPPDLH